MIPLNIRLFLALCMLSLTSATAEDNLGPFKAWLEKQASVRAIAADFDQIRAFHTLKSPVVVPGSLVMTAKGNFRWELGNPVKMIAIKKGDEGIWIEPQKKKAEKWSAVELQSSGKMNQAAMMQFPETGSWKEFEKKFQILETSLADGIYTVSFVPREDQARKFLERISFAFVPGEVALSYFEIALKDGTKMRNQFHNVRINPKLDSACFDYDLTGYSVREAKP